MAIIRISVVLTLLLFLHANVFGQDMKTASALLIDNTGSMREQFNRIKEIGKALAKNLTSRGPVSLFCFEPLQVKSDRWVTVANGGTPWITVPDPLINTIDSMVIEGGQTQLLDAIRSVAELAAAKAKTDGLSGKYLVIITDGDERASRRNMEANLAVLKSSGTRIFAIGLVEELTGSEKKDAIKLLTQITSETGGYAIFPKAKDKTTLDAVITDLFANHPLPTTK